MATAISIDRVSKQYRLGVVNYGMLYKDLQSWVARKLGKPDPHADVGKPSRTGSQEHFWALKDVSLDITQGDRIGIIGRNGAGKSTLLKILSRVTAPTEGTIRVRGRIASLLEVGTGFHPELTGRENVYLNGAILGMKTREIDRKMSAILAFAETEKFADTPVKRYSSGMYVRLAFSVAVHLDNEILVADEVLAVGDVAFQNKCITKMREISTEEGRTILYVSHNIGSLQKLCENGVLLESGKVAYCGSMEATIDEYVSSKTLSNVGRNFESSCGRFTLDVPFWVNEKGEQVHSYEFGSEVILRFDFNFLKPVKRINPGFAVIDRTGQRVFTSHMADDRSYKARHTYEGHVILDTNLDLPSLAPGHYVVTFGIRDENENTVIYSENDLMLEITQGQTQKNAAAGILWHTSKWIEKN